MCLTNHLETGLRFMPSQSVTRLPPLVTGLALICQGFLLKLGSSSCPPHGPAWEGLVAQGPSTVMVKWYCNRLTTTVSLRSEPGHPTSPSIHIPAPSVSRRKPAGILDFLVTAWSCCLWPLSPEPLRDSKTTHRSLS